MSALHLFGIVLCKALSVVMLWALPYLLLSEHRRSAWRPDHVASQPSQGTSVAVYLPLEVPVEVENVYA